VGSPNLRVRIIGSRTGTWCHQPQDTKNLGLGIPQSLRQRADEVHALLEHRATPFRLLVGHSKGALQIDNAIRSLPAKKTRGLQIVTLGCPIGEEIDGVDYQQYLGLFDALGKINAWGRRPNHWPATWHSTNPALPPAMAAGELTLESVRS